MRSRRLMVILLPILIVQVWMGGFWTVKPVMARALCPGPVWSEPVSGCCGQITAPVRPCHDRESAPWSKNCCCLENQPAGNSMEIVQTSGIELRPLSGGLVLPSVNLPDRRNQPARVSPSPGLYTPLFKIKSLLQI